MKNPLFYSDEYKKIESKIKDFLNNQSDFLSPRTVSSTRAVGDAIQELLADNLQSILGSLVKEYVAKFPRRSMADIAFSDKEGFYYVIDVKTHRLDTRFNMPNLTSVDRLAKFYEDDKHYFVTLIVAYNLEETRVIVESVHFVPIEFLSWPCLTIGALGWGQIQIANSNKIDILAHGRKAWMLELCGKLLDFYPAEVGKIKKRIDRFKKVQIDWLAKKD